MKAFALLFAAGCLLGSCAKKDKNPVTPPNNNSSTVDTSRVKTSSGGKYRVIFAAPDTVMLDDTIQFPMTVKMASDTSVGAAGLNPVAEFWHVGMSHVSALTPAVADSGGGAYRISDVCACASMPMMTGEWNLRIVMGPLPPDTVVFRVEAK